MADTPAPPLDDVSRIITFFHGKGVKSKCPMCEAASWTLHSSNHGQAIDVILPVKSSYNPIDIPAYALVCTNCGFIRLHSKVAIDGIKP